jgi:hypothetical protein
MKFAMSPPRDFLLDGRETLSAISLHLRLDSRRASAVMEFAQQCGIDNPEVVRRMIDFWISHHPAEINA